MWRASIHLRGRRVRIVTLSRKAEYGAGKLSGRARTNGLCVCHRKELKATTSKAGCCDQISRTELNTLDKTSI